jgi:hypothetical protein
MCRIAINVILMTFENYIIYIDALATPLQDNFNLLLKQNKNKQTKGGFQGCLLKLIIINRQSD